MAQYYRWIKAGSEDLTAARQRRLQYTQEHGSEKCFWVFDMEKEYRPREGLVQGRILVHLNFDEASHRKITDPRNWIYSEDTFNEGISFKGEAKHPDRVIVKQNEQGAYGIGITLLAELTVVSTALADLRTVGKALGITNKREYEDAAFRRRWPQTWS